MNLSTLAELFFRSTSTDNIHRSISTLNFCPGESGWFFLSLGCAFFTATTATLSKIMLKKKSEFLVIWVMLAFSLPILLLLTAPIYQPSVHLSVDFWKTVAIMLPFELMALLMYMRALKLSPLSLVFPFLGLTPVFTILTSSIILKEKLAPSGVAGVLLVSLGAYLLNANKINEGVLGPIKSIYREKGSLLMVFVAFIYSFLSVLGKKAVFLSSPRLFPVIYYSIFFAILTPLAYPSIKLACQSLSAARQNGFAQDRRLKIEFEKKDIFLFLAIGVTFSLAILFHFKAIALINVPYMISVKRLSLILSVLYGAIIFKEKNIGYRILGSLVMISGVLMLLLAR